MDLDFIDDEALQAARRELNGEAEVPKEFVYACRVEELPKSCEHGKVIVTDETEIAIFNLDGRIFATSNICPHEMSPLLAAGAVDCSVETVTCPLHGWVFDIPTGRQLAPAEGSGNVPVYEVKVADGEVWVREKMD